MFYYCDDGRNVFVPNVDTVTHRFKENLANNGNQQIKHLKNKVFTRNKI
jgi:hypothetical protein